MFSRYLTLRRIYYKTASERYGLAKLGITRPTTIHYNLNYDDYKKYFNTPEYQPFNDKKD